MANEYHILREGGISLQEWKQAVASVPGIRLDSSPMTATNPKTGQRISIDGRDGDVAVLLRGNWLKVFHFFERSATFKSGVVDLDDPDHPIVFAAFALARILSAKIVNEDGDKLELPDSL